MDASNGRYKWTTIRIIEAGNEWDREQKKNHWQPIESIRIKESIFAVIQFTFQCGANLPGNLWQISKMIDFSRCKIDFID